MENLVKQMRVRFSGLELDSQEAADNKISQRRLPSQKTQSFKKGRGQQNWFKRQFSGNMDEGNNFSDSIEFAAVVAAAAFAVNSLEDAELQGCKQATDRPEASLIRIKSRKDQEQGEASTRNSETAEQMIEEDATVKHKPPEKAVVPTIRKPSFTDNYSTSIGSKPERAAAPASYKYPRDDHSEKARNSRSYGETDAIADNWEKAEMERIKKEYERVSSTILSWESEKKAKAERQLDRVKRDTEKKRERALQHYHSNQNAKAEQRLARVERDIEKKRERAVQHYRSEISRIEQIGAGARAEADEKRRNDEFKIKETANKIRVTGKVPVKCFCF